jgi:hypothetical protein
VTVDSAELRTAAVALAETDPSYVEHIRRAAGRLAARDGDPGDAPGALLVLEDSATIDVEVPVASTTRAGTLLKTGVRRLSAWYLRYVAEQVTLFGQATVRLGTALVDRTDQLTTAAERQEKTASVLRHDLDGLAERVRRLEHGAAADEGAG